MNNPIMSMLMNQLRGKNPQMFQIINQAQNNGVNPQDMLKQMMGGIDTQQMQNIMQQAKQMGCPDNVLSQLQNLK